MEVTKEQLQQLIELCENQQDEFYVIAKHLAEKELYRRNQSTGRQTKYEGTAKERNKQAQQAVRERKRLEEALNRDRLKKSDRRAKQAIARAKNLADEPIDLRVKKKKRHKWRKRDKVT